MTQQKAKPKTMRVVTKHDVAKKAINIVPKTTGQEAYLKALGTAEQTVVLGPSGTGKTYRAASLTTSLYYVEKINKIVIIRFYVFLGEKFGFLLGDLREKTEPWVLPVLDVLDEHLGKDIVDTFIKNGNTEIAPIALMRGRSFSDAFIICDEAQNLTLHELKMLLTRVGEGSKLVVNGDVMQSDLKEADGLTQVVKLIEKYDLPISICELGVDDLVRSAMTKMWVETFMKEGI